MNIVYFNEIKITIFLIRKNIESTQLLCYTDINYINIKGEK